MACSTWEWAGTVFEALSEIQEPGSGLDGLPESYYWKDALKLSVAPTELYIHLGLPRFRCVLLSGPAGNGKHTTAEALAETVANSCGCERERILKLRLRAEDFPENLTHLEAIEKITSLFDLFEDAMDTYAILIFDQISSYGNSEVIMNSIADCMPSVENCFVVCVAEEQNVFNSDIRSQALRLTLGPPDKELRRAYLDSKLQQTVEDWEHPGMGMSKIVQIGLSGLTIEDLLTETEGYSYSELERFSYFLTSELVAKQPDGGSLIYATLEKARVKNCLRLAKESLMQIPTVFGVQQVALGHQEEQVNQEKTRVSALTNKKNRSFAENLELITSVH